MRKLLLLLVFALNATCIYAGQVTVRGTVKNQKDSVIVFNQNDFDAITRAHSYKRHEALINKDGSFEVTLPLARITEWVVHLDGDFELIHLAPDKNVTLLVDFKNQENTLSAIGENSEYVNFDTFLSKNLWNKYDRTYYQRIAKLSAPEFLKEQQERSQKQLALLTAYSKNHKVDKAYAQWLKIKCKYEPYERTLVENVPGNLRGDDKINAMLIQAGINDDYASKNSSLYNDLVFNYMHYLFNKSTFPLAINKMLNMPGNPLKGLTQEVFYTRLMSSLVRVDDSIYNKGYTLFSKKVKDRELRSIVDNSRQEYLSDSKKAEKVNIDQNLALKAIFEKYKGKVIYVDFWASWCAPCRAEMPNAATLKQKLAGKDVVFLYFGYRDDKMNWLKAREESDIKGEHFLLNDATMKEADKLFEINGIPHYAIIDKGGNIVNKKAGRPDYAYKELVKYIEQE